MKENSLREIAGISRHELHLVSWSTFSSCEACLEVWDRHFANCLPNEVKLNCRRRTNYKCPTDAGFVYHKALVTAAVLRLEIKDILCVVAMRCLIIYIW